jgi:hypothetical protein
MILALFHIGLTSRRISMSLYEQNEDTNTNGTAPSVRAHRSIFGSSVFLRYNCARAGPATTTRSTAPHHRDALSTSARARARCTRCEFRKT